MPVCIAQTVQEKYRQGHLHSPRWRSCQRRMPLRTAGCIASCHTRLERPQGDTLVDVLERGYRVVACRGKRLAAVVVLPRPGARRSPGLAGTRGASRQVPRDALVGLPGKLLLLGPCRLELKYFVLEWLQGNHGGSWRSPGKPCRGVLQLPVHKFGVLGYPYSSTPTVVVY